MDHPCSDLLADTGRPRDQHPATSRSHALQRRANIVDRDGRPVELVVLPDLLAEDFVFAAQPIGLSRTADEMDQAVRLEGLLDEIDRTFAEPPPRPCRDCRARRDHQNRQCRGPGA